MTDADDEAKKIQAAYYATTASYYDVQHVDPVDEHAMALGWLAAVIEQRRYESVLDVGSGTGRALLYLKEHSGSSVRGIEPSQALREIGYAKGLSALELMPGNALALDFADDTFDVVCAFGILHHIADHRRAVAEMCRIARKAVFVSDANNFGQGSPPSRIFKQSLNALGLWPFFDYVRTGFKGYHYSEGDGIFYSYCIHKDVSTLRTKFPDVHYMSTRPSGYNLYRSAQTLAVLATRSVAAS